MSSPSWKSLPIHKMWWLSVISLLALISSVHSVAVVSVDLGSEFMKIAVVSVIKSIVVISLYRLIMNHVSKYQN